MEEEKWREMAESKGRGREGTAVGFIEDGEHWEQHGRGRAVLEAHGSGGGGSGARA